MSRFVKPETRTLTLANGDRITVKAQLSCGEERAAHARLYVRGADGVWHIDPAQLGVGLIAAYLLDWTFTDDDGQLVPIRGLSREDLIAVVDSLDTASFAELHALIQAHELATIEARTQKKTIPSTANGSEAISISVN